MKTLWQIKFKVVDKKARAKHAKSVLSDINVTMPTEMVNFILQGIISELRRIDEQEQHLQKGLTKKLPKGVTFN